jgi:hypothetical protein
MKEIRGDAKNIRALLANAKYAIDYYQREYRWETKQITELMDDLAEKFEESYEAGHDREMVDKYGHYFLGSIIISDRDTRKYIIDGQQRLTSLTLLLIFLHRNIEDAELRGQIAELIFSQRLGKKSFNLNVDERTPCMEALYKGETFDENGQPESVVNILGRYRDIEDSFPQSLRGAALPYFADWLMENVHLVEITAYSDDDAYTIFETMNDRGLSLTPTDMLKGYLLANIGSPEARNKASMLWKSRIASLQQIGKDEDADAIKSWLRSQYAESIRERKPRALPRDFDLIGTEFHRWVRDHDEALGLKSSADYSRLVEKEFSFYAQAYARVREAGETLTPGLEAIHYNAENNFTLQYPLLLAPLRQDDTEQEMLRKLRVVASFIDILITRRIWNFRAMDYSTMQYAMFVAIREIRGKSAREVAEILRAKLDALVSMAPMAGRFGASSPASPNGLKSVPGSLRAIQNTPTPRGRMATKSNTSGRTITNVIWMNSPTRRTSTSTETESEDCCSCRSHSTPATATWTTRRSASTTGSRTFSRKHCMKAPTITTRDWAG